MNPVNPESEKEITAAIKLLMRQCPTLVLAENGMGDLTVIPATIDNGVIEYQVSDGLEGERGQSMDVYSFKEAMDLYNKYRADGFPTTAAPIEKITQR